ncbi:hypothetical protein [Actinomadura nitritigenes]|uniref:hypothetical protein n=1 Tax=Actinomadura nitritigenes TaxID=134602 RepID=UPI003D8C7906
MTCGLTLELPQRSVLGPAPESISRHVAPPVRAGLAPGGPPISEAEWAERIQERCPQLRDTRLLRQVTWPTNEVHRHYTADQLERNVTKSTIHQRLADE